MRKPSESKPVCYLCGQTIEGDVSADHMPPRQFYSKEIRKLHGPNLRTLPTHLECNHSYQLDEEYFIHSLAPLALESYAGKSIFRELLSQYERNRNTVLSKKVLNEFEERPSGLYLPSNKVVKRIDPDRIWRGAWKIIRGLFYYEHNRILPENTRHLFKVVSPGEKPPEEFSFIPDVPIRGQYPGVFDYKYRIFPDMKNSHLWALLLWDCIIILSFFDDPECVSYP